MKLYRHYKGNFYKLREICRHSETNEELVLYETFSDNPTGKVWVRPKTMFFEDVEVGGQKRPRFEPVPLRIETTESVTARQIEILGPLMKEIFSEWNIDDFHATFKNRTKFHLCLGYIEAKPVAFKLGYENKTGEFYSWLGGVHPDYRGLEFAHKLMLKQREWCERQGYKKITMKTLGRFRQMLSLSLRHGFEIYGTERHEDGSLKILLEKRL